MAVRRCRCGYQTEDVWANDCPVCLRPLGLTNRCGPGPGTRPAGGWFRPRTALLAAALVGLPVVGLGVLTADRVPAGRPAARADGGRVRVGMTVEDAVLALEPDGPADEDGPSLSSLLEPGAPRSGRFTWVRGTRHVRVTFRDGRVTHVGDDTLPAPAPPKVKIEPDR